MMELASTIEAETLSHARSDLRVRSFAELVASNIPKRKPLLGSWLNERDLSLLYAPAGVGKSLAAMSIALAIAGSGSFLGWTASEARRVLVIDGEIDVADLQERAVMLAKALPDVDLELVGERLRFLARMDQEPGRKFPDIANRDDYAEIVSHVTACGASLVILDNVSCLADVQDENAASSFNTILDLLQLLKQHGCAVLAIHHARKGGGKVEGGYRGSSKLAVLFDSIISLSHPHGVPSRSNAEFIWHFEKFRRRRDESLADFKASLVVEPNGLRWSREDDLNSQIVELVRLVETVEYKNREQLAAAMGVSTGKLSNLKAKALATGRITANRWRECLTLAARGAPEDDTTVDQGEDMF